MTPNPRTFPAALALAATLALCLAPAAPARAADPLRDDSRWELLLPRTGVTELVRWGRWLAAAQDGGGVWLYDPVAGESRALDTSRGLRGNRVQALAVDASGQLWVGSMGGAISRISPELAARSVTGLLSLDVTALATDGAFTYYGTPEGAGRITSGLPDITFTTDDGLAAADVGALAAGGDFAWFGGSGGVTLFDRIANELRDGNGGLGGDLAVRDLARVGGYTWLALADGVRRWDPVGEAWEAPSLVGDLLSLGAAGDTLLALGADATLHRLVDPVAQAWSPTAAGASERVLRVAAGGPEGQTWLGGSLVDPLAVQGDPRALLRRLDGTVERSQRGLFGTDCRGLEPDGAGGFWVGSFPPRDGITHWRADGSVQAYSLVQAQAGVGWTLRGPRIAIERDQRGDLWVSAFTRGVARVSPHPSDDPALATYLELSPDDSPLQSRRVVRMSEDPAGRLWMLSDGQQGDGTLNAGIDLLVDPTSPLDPASWLKIAPNFPPESQLAGPAVWSAVVVAGSEAWLAVPGVGVQRWRFTGTAGPGQIDPATITDPNDWTTFDAAGFVSLLDITALVVMPDLTFWAATAGNGIVHFAVTPNGLDLLDVVTGGGFAGSLISGIVRDLAVDGFGDLWVATDASMHRVRGTGSELVVDAWTDLEAFVLRDLGRNFLPEILSPLPGTNLQRLAVAEGGETLFVATSAAAAAFDLGGQGGGGGELAAIVPYPNPVRGGDAGLRLTGYEGGADVEVFNLQGSLLARSTGVPEGEIAWDTLDITGAPVAPGLYVVQVRLAQGQVSRCVVAVER